MTSEGEVTETAARAAQSWPLRPLVQQVLRGSRAWPCLLPASHSESMHTAGAHSCTWPCGPWLPDGQLQTWTGPIGGPCRQEGQLGRPSAPSCPPAPPAICHSSGPPLETGRPFPWGGVLEEPGARVSSCSPSAFVGQTPASSLPRRQGVLCWHLIQADGGCDRIGTPEDPVVP